MIKPGTPTDSQVVICEVSSTDLTIADGTCSIINNITSSIRLPHTFSWSPTYSGLEDCRAFSKNNKIYVHGTANIRRVAADGSVLDQQRIALVELDASLQVVVRGVLLADDHVPLRIKQKNWAPLVLKNDKLLFVVSVDPLRVVDCDELSGRCTPVYKDVVAAASKLMAAAGAGAHVHGGSPFVDLGNDTFASVVHRGVDYPFGRIYTHHIITIRASETRGFSLTAVSKPFRWGTNFFWWWVGGGACGSFCCCFFPQVFFC